MRRLVDQPFNHDASVGSANFSPLQTKNEGAIERLPVFAARASAVRSVGGCGWHQRSVMSRRPGSVAARRTSDQRGRRSE